MMLTLLYSTFDSLIYITSHKKQPPKYKLVVQHLLCSGFYFLYNIIAKSAQKIEAFFRLDFCMFIQIHYSAFAAITRAQRGHKPFSSSVSE